MSVPSTCTPGPNAPDEATITCHVSPAKARSPAALTSQGMGAVVSAATAAPTL